MGQPPLVSFNLAMSSNLLIEAQGLGKSFGNETAVIDIDLTVPAGTIFGFIGPSGCGKTTTVRLLNGSYKPTAGRLTVFGSEPSQFSRADKARVGYMPQLFSLYPALSLQDNLNFIGSLYGLGRAERSERQEQLLELVELADDKHKLARDVSGGMQRRLSLAAALMHKPELIFLDEPTAGIDPILRQKLWEFFRQLRDEGQTLFVTTQYVGEAAYCDYVGVMAEGRLLTVDTPERLRRTAIGGDMIDIVLQEALPAALLYELRAHELVQHRLNFLAAAAYRLTVEDAKTALPELMRWFEGHQLSVTSVGEFVPQFDDIFVELIKRGQQHD